MARYDYRCRVCDSSFEVRRGITEDAAAAVPCPAGHVETSRVFSAVAVSRGSSMSMGAPAPMAGGGGGGCCGGACGCG
ncbi:zinc ribbon domain-containing protein [Frankia sp. AgB1.9]|uniref:FmdB family zinc ribbon protein n=1 Tax=unclassified Frankia TaxID=2632575 RepID=UPI001933DBFE|nr:MULTISPECIES: zinc ribbon domain-containing protein [unclassified Frankia]MBL7490994.1 zinc ribbon domain-containing protein [Frankia sp. AgW1.1]MBL7551744.1 zinc ribbon domain-containing protein [Frankia sp. AgB1.9]MBL7623203.1 zinc ribbon domain-containing protein [Frankia sp. AgB1.8]